MTEWDTLIRERNERIRTLLEPWETVPPTLSEDERGEWWMHAALELAKQAAREGEIPVGCVIVRDNRILAGDYNGRETFRDALYHAESAAIRKASQILGGWRLVGCTLYVTMEPCPMCAGAVWAARVPRVVIGAKDARAGAMGSVIRLNRYPLNHKPEIRFGVLERECREVLQAFFRTRRQNPASDGQSNRKRDV